MFYFDEFSYDLQDVYHSRPFKVRNADEYDLENILDLFIDPTEGLNNPFEFENSIIKGRMGSGKTIYLRANHAYYVYTLIPSIIEQAPLVLPIYIKLSDFQHIQNSNEIYNAFIIKLIKEISSVYLHLQDANKLAQMHNGILTLPTNIFKTDSKINNLLNELRKLTSTEYIEKISKELGFDGKIKPKFFEASANYRNQEAIEIKQKKIPGIGDVENAFEKLLKPFNGKILLLIDEAGSVSKSFFKEEDNSSIFEVLMNQLRTTSFIRTKIAIYPQSYSDILTEIRYGDAINLHEDITNNNGYESFKKRGISLINKYLTKAINHNITYTDIFDEKNNEDESDILEQIINASSGNMRRFVQLLDLSMNEAYKANKGYDKVNIIDVFGALKEHAISMERLYTDIDKEFLSSLVSTCRNRTAYKFQFPNKAPSLMKYINKSSEYNILNIVDFGKGQRGTVYSFDYAFCVYRDIPTHYIKDSERIDKTRSRNRGEWIKKVTQVSERLIELANLPGKIEGKVTFVTDTGGFLKSDDGNEYYFNKSNIIPEDKNKPIIYGKRLRFYPIRYEDSIFARDIEVL